VCVKGLVYVLKSWVVLYDGPDLHPKILWRVCVMGLMCNTLLVHLHEAVSLALCRYVIFVTFLYLFNQTHNFGLYRVIINVTAVSCNFLSTHLLC